MQHTDLTRLQNEGYFHESTMAEHIDKHSNVYVTAYGVNVLLHDAFSTKQNKNKYSNRIELDDDGGCKVVMPLSDYSSTSNRMIEGIKKAKCIKLFCTHSNARLEVGQATEVSFENNKCTFLVKTLSVRDVWGGILKDGTLSKLHTDNIGQLQELGLVNGPTDVNGFDGRTKLSNMYMCDDGRIEAVKLLIGGGKYENAVYYDKATLEGWIKMPLSGDEATRSRMEDLLRSAKESRYSFRVVWQCGQEQFTLGDATVHSVLRMYCIMHTRKATTPDPTAVARAAVKYDSIGEVGWHAFLMDIDCGRASMHQATFNKMPTGFGGSYTSVYTPDIVVDGHELEIVRGWKSTTAILEIKASFPMQEAKLKCEVVARNKPGTPVVLIYGRPVVPFSEEHGNGLDFSNSYRAIAYRCALDETLEVRDSLVFVDDGGRIFLDEVKLTSDRRWTESERLLSAYAAASDAMQAHPSIKRHRSS